MTLLKIKVRFGNGQSVISGDTGIIFTKVRRENNRANLDVMKQISQLCNIPMNRIRLISGHSSTKKVSEIL